MEKRTLDAYAGGSLIGLDVVSENARNRKLRTQAPESKEDNRKGELDEACE